MDARDRLAPSGRVLVGGLVFGTGVAALLNQIAWQRVIALHAGVDLSSSTTVVVAFLGGLGIGNLAGGRLAGRLDRLGALRVLGAAGLAEAAFSLISVWMLYDVYRSFATELEALPLRVGFNVAVLLIPTTLMGLSLPLVARVVATDLRLVGSQVGRYYASNTMGAAFGAFAGGWVILGTQGFVGAVRVAAFIQMVTGICYLGISWSLRRARTWWGSATGLLVVAGLAGSTYVAVEAVAAEVSDLRWFGPAIAGGAAAATALAGAVAFGWRGAAPRAVGDVSSLASHEVGLDGREPTVASVRRSPDSALSRVSVRWWYLAYAGTGAVAIGFEQVFFRLVDGVMRSNSYTFAHVLSLYLGLLAMGTAVGSRLRRRVADDRAAFLWIQFGVGVSAVATLLVFTQVLPSGPLEPRFDEWFNSDGFAGGFGSGEWSNAVAFGLVLPLWLMAVPVLLMGAGFPFVQGIVTDRLDQVGRRTGTLIFANLTGNVFGALVTSFVLIEHLGTIGAYRVLLLPLGAAGLVVALAARPSARPLRVGAVGAVVLAGSLALPSNDALWATLHGTEPDAILVAEDRSCASAVEVYDDDHYQLTINGAGQNGYPFDDFHVLVGLLPALAHPAPQRGLAVGFGIGSTSYAMLASERVGAVDTVEICGGNYDLGRRLADRGLPEFRRVMDDPDHRRITGDGRRHLLVTDQRYDLIVPDTLRPSSAGSGALYSLEFQQLVASRLTPDGMAVGWIPSWRVLAAVAATYPHVVLLRVPSYNDSPYFVASRSPLDLDRGTLLERFDSMDDDALPAHQREDLRSYLATIEPECVNDGRRAPRPPTGARENLDLWPRDEYFLNNGAIGEQMVPRTCGP